MNSFLQKLSLANETLRKKPRYKKYPKITKKRHFSKEGKNSSEVVKPNPLRFKTINTFSKNEIMCYTIQAIHLRA